MPRVSDDIILSRALTPASLDRQTFAEAYDSKGPDAEKALAQKAAIEGLRSRRLKELTPAERETARLALIYAEQWESSLADANSGLPDEKEPRAAAATFRRMRLRLWGPTALEAALAVGTRVVVSPR